MAGLDVHDAGLDVLRHRGKGFAQILERPHGAGQAGAGRGYAGGLRLLLLGRRLIG